MTARNSVSEGASSKDGLRVPRITLTVEEAAGALGVSRDHIERHVLPSIRVVYSGRRRLVPVKELERWADEQATRWKAR